MISSYKNFYLNLGLIAGAAHAFERPALDVGLHHGVVELPAHQAVGGEDRVLGIARDLIRRGLANQSLCTRKCDTGWPLGDDLNGTIVPTHADTGMSGSEINSDRVSR